MPIAMMVMAGVSYFARHRDTACTAALPANFSLSECGSWQSVQRTRLAYILLCRNESYSYTSSRICPSAWYRPANSSAGS